MRYKLKIILLLFVGFFSCEEDSKISFDEVSITTSLNTIVEVNIPKAIGDELISNSINKSIRNHIIYSLHTGDTNKINSQSIEQSIDNFNNEFNSFKTDFPDSPQNWEAQIDGEIMYQSKDIISIAVTTYANTGGAHGNLSIRFLNFNAINGNLIINSDLYNDDKAFTNIANSFFKKVIKNKEGLYFEPNKFKLPESIGYNYSGVVLLYNVYEIAPYSTGITEFIIPFEEIESLMNFE